MTTGNSVRKLTQAHDMSAKTIQAIFHKHMKLSKKSARWLPNLTKGDEEGVSQDM
jgi:hypothetical protein